MPVFRLKPLGLLAFEVCMWAALAMLKPSRGGKTLSGSHLSPSLFPPTPLIKNFMKKMASELSVEGCVEFQQVEMKRSSG